MIERIDRSSWAVWVGRSSSFAAPAVCIAAFGAALLGACAQPRNQPAHLATTDEGHGLHTVANNRLRALMGDLCSLDFDRLSSELHAGKKPYRDINDVAGTAAALASDARMIPRFYKGMEMSPESRRVFDQLAAKLHDECVDLGALARHRELSKMKAQIDRVVATCNSCHESFRGPKLAGMAPVAAGSGS